MSRTTLAGAQVVVLLVADEIFEEHQMATPYRSRWLYYCKLRRLNKFTAIKLVFFIIILTYVIIGMDNDVEQSSKKYLSSGHSASLLEAIAARASQDRYIVLAMVDEAFTDMALNFYEASLRPHHIDNYLFVGVGNSTCDVLYRQSVACFHYVNDQSDREASEFGDSNFIRKMNIRTDMILEALEANFTVVHSDTDVSFLANPLDEIKTVMETADVAALWDSDDYNAGFIVVKPTNISKHLYQTVKSLTIKSPKITDQAALNNATEILQKQNTGLAITALNKQRFLSGLDYFEKERRLFPINGDDKCSRTNQTSCVVVVHNNWIVGKAAKIYRYREHLMWLYDGDDQYYTSITRLYLCYSNKQPTNRNLFNEKRASRVEYEISALKTAMTIGYLLNRTVILPRFCVEKRGVESPLNSLIHIKTFETEFSGMYRENSFLRHPKVPHCVKSEFSKQLMAFGIAESLTSPHRKVNIFRSDILRQFGNVKAKVLEINNLHSVKVILGYNIADLAFTEKVRRAFYHSDYKQSRRW